jgi:hypothetical protein
MERKQIQALFQVHDVLERKAADGSVTSQIVRLGAAYAPDPNNVNHAFWLATPTSSLEMTISNPSAFDAFVPGKQYLLTFEQAEG